MCKNFLILILCTYTIVCFGQDWNFTPIGNGIRPTILLDNNDQPNITYLTESSNGFIYISRKNQNEFESTALSNGLFLGPLDIAIDFSNLARIVYHDVNLEDLVQLREVSPNNWIANRIESSNVDGIDPSIFIDAEGASHFASIDPIRGVEYGFYDPPFKLVNSIEGVNLSGGYGTSIIVEPGNKIHISYYNSNENELKYLIFENNTWSGEAITADGLFPSMILNDSSQVNIAFYKEIITGIGQIAVAKKSSDNWVIEVVDTLSNIDLTKDPHKLTDLKYKNGVYHLAYSDQKVVKYAQKADDSWNIQTIVNQINSQTTLGQQTSLDVDENENIHLAFYEIHPNLPGGGIIQYSTNIRQVNLEVECPENFVLLCSTDHDPDLTGRPIIIDDGNVEVSISYEDLFEPADCKIENDTLFRTWTIQNTENKSVLCEQIIISYYLNPSELILPNDTIHEFNECYEDVSDIDFGTVSNFCSNLELNSTDFLISSNCESEIQVERRWRITDECNNLMYSHTQKIALIPTKSFSIDTIAITPDGGNSTGAIRIEVSCGIPPYMFFWSNNSRSSELLNLSAGTYSFTVTDRLGCLESMDIQIPQVGSKTLLTSQIVGINGNAIPEVQTDFRVLNDQIEIELCENTDILKSYCVSDTSSVDGELVFCISKDENPAAKVSVVDLVKAQRIILGLVNPCFYNLVAGDVNFSGSLTAADLVSMQRIILGLSPDFPSGKSWVFLKDDQIVECDTFMANSIPIINLTYTGLKLGDLACQDTLISITQDQFTEIRSTRMPELIIPNKFYKKGEVVEIPIYVKDFAFFLGFQAALKYDNQSLQFINLRSSLLNIAKWHHIPSEHAIRLMDFSGTEMNYPDSSELAWIKFEILKDMELGSAMYLSDKFDNTMYDDQQINHKLSLQFLDKLEPNMEHLEEVLLYPNPFISEINLIVNSTLPGKNSEVIIRDLSGKTVYNLKIPNLKVSEFDQIKIPLSSLKPGLYFLSFQNSQNIIIKRIVKI